VQHGTARRTFMPVEALPGRPRSCRHRDYRDGKQEGEQSSVIPEADTAHTHYIGIVPFIVPLLYRGKAKDIGLT
jgi:hypothetical protein